MGVELELFCHKCKQRIDLHKFRLIHDIMNRDAPLKWKSEAFVNPERAEFDRYWGARAFWFLWKHREHGNEVKLHSDHDDEGYWDIRADYEEVFPND